MVAITGANGLLGSHVTSAFVRERVPVKAVVRTSSNRELLSTVKDSIQIDEADVLDIAQLSEAFTNVETVVHVAGMVSFNPRNKKALMQINAEGTRNVVNACLDAGVKNMVHISSVAALGRVKGKKNISEDSKWADSPHNTHYAESKYLAELEVYRGMEEGLCVSIINPSVVLAPVKSGQSSSQIFTYVSNERKFYGDGVINYVDVRDVTTMVVTLASDIQNGERFIANAGAVNIKILLDAIATRMDKKKPIIRVGHRLSKVAAVIEELRAGMLGTEPLLTRQSVRILEEDFFFDSAKAKKQLNIQFRTLDETLDWCCNSLKNSR